MVYIPISARGRSTTSTQKVDYNDVDQLRAFAQSKGLKIKGDKPGLFKRTLDFISRPLYASAGASKALVKRVRTGEWRENPLEEAWKGITAKEKETYSDVLREAGVRNKWLRGGVGFALDVALDPLTYTGAGLIKKVGQVGRVAGKVGLAGGRKVLPRATATVELAGRGLKDSLGKAFDVNYGLTKAGGRTVADDISKFYNIKGIGKEDIVNSTSKLLNRFDKKTLSEAKDIMFQNKSLERLSRKDPLTPLSKLDPLAQKAKKYKSAEEFWKAEHTLSLDSISPNITYENFLKSPGGNLPSLTPTKPIDVAMSDGKVLISDGVHRYFEAVKRGDKSIKVRYPKSQLTDIYKQATAKAPVDYIKSSGKTAEAIQAMKSLGAKIGKQAEIPQPFENYIPSILKMKDRMIKDLPAGVKVGKEGYLKEFKDLLPKGKRLEDPVELYSRRQYEVFSDNLARETLDKVIKGYGKPISAFKNADEALEQGYKIVKDKTFGKKLGYLKENDFRYVNSNLFPEMKTIDMLAKASGYDSFTRFFKTAVTAWFPAFHVRNYISGNVQNYSTLGASAFNPVNHSNALGFLKATPKKLTFPKWSGTGKDMNKILKEEFGAASRYISDLTDYIEELGTKGFKVKSNIQKLDPRQVGNFIEMNQKAVAVSTALKQGKTLPEALKLAEKAGFDYSKITQFESKIMRRAIPFYTFARKNAELQVRTAVKNPERILNQIKFTQNLSEIFGGRKPTEEELDGLPDWALDSLGFKLEGNRYLTKFGLPVEEFVERIAKPSKTTLTSLNPLVKFPLESKLGYDFFREQDIIDINKIAPVTGKLVLNKAPDWLKDILRVKKVETDYGTKYYASPKALHKLRNIPTARFQGTFEKLFDKDTEKVDKWLAFLTGAKIYDIDTQLQKYFKDRDLKRDVQDQLMGIGEGKEFKQFYIPKN